MASSSDTPIRDILVKISEARTRLPDFQRGWVWDDNRIRALIASVTKNYPVGALMFLEYGGEEIRFKSRAFTNVEDNGEDANVLVLDGQQRLTSLFCSMKSHLPTPTRRSKNGDIKRYYYLDIKKSLNDQIDRFDAVVSVPEDKVIREDFGRKVVTDLKEAKGEYAAGLFPLNIIFNVSKMNKWKNGYREYHDYDKNEIRLLDEFDERVLTPTYGYQLPVIMLDKDTPKDAVCQVFENVNTGGVTLTVFELVTASFAADGFGLRDDWGKQKETMREDEGSLGLLEVVDPTDFLLALTLLSQASDKMTLSCKRKDVLNLTLDNYKKYADKLVEGFTRAARFLVEQNILLPKNLPYSTQMIPLAVICSILGTRCDDGLVRTKLAQWYWSGVFGEMYGGANETRYAKDVAGVINWINGGEEPDTMTRAFFYPQRLLSLQTRNSAAYKGVMALILGNGAKDFISGSKMDFTNFSADSVDIHHVFPQAYCKEMGFDKHKWNSIINKSPISYRTNRSIGGVAPSIYLEKIEQGETREKIDDNVKSHGIQVDYMRSDDFEGFIIQRAKTLLELIGSAMGKRIGDLDSTDVIDVFGTDLK